MTPITPLHVQAADLAVGDVVDHPVAGHGEVVGILPRLLDAAGVPEGFTLTIQPGQRMFPVQATVLRDRPLPCWPRLPRAA